MSNLNLRVLLLDGDGTEYNRICALVAPLAPTPPLIHRVSSLDEALDALHSQAYDICLLSSGNRNGIEFLKAASDSDAAAPIVVLLTDGEHGRRMPEAIQHGAEDCVDCNRMEPAQVCAVIRTAIERRRRQSEIRERHSRQLAQADAALQQEAAERRRIEEQLRRNEELYHRLAESAQDYIGVVDRQSRIRYLNSFTAKEFGVAHIAPGELTLNDLFRDDTLLRETRDTRQVLDTGEPVHMVSAFTTASGERWIDKKVIPLRTPDGQVECALFMGRDVTEQRLASLAVEDACRKLQMFDQAKSEFVSKVSHELRTPLTSMIHACHNLLKGAAGPLPPQALRYIKTFDAECRRLLKTASDILDLRKIEQGKLVLTRVSIPFSRLLERSVEAIQPQAEAKILSIHMDRSGPAGCVSCDPEKLTRVVQNIVGNAIKYSEPGGHVRISLSGDPSQSAQLMLCIEDDGIGIPPEALGHVSEMYFRADERRPGAGLGLAISKEIIELHGGTLRIQSPPPGQIKGTRVEVRLPTANAPLILVVDDDPTALQVMQAQLASKGYRVETASCVGEAMGRTTELKPDAIVTDLILGDGSGCDLIVAIKSDMTHRGTPMIAVTGGNIDQERFDVLHSFGIPTLSKPWREGEILDELEAALAGRTIFREQNQ